MKSLNARFLSLIGVSVLMLIASASITQAPGAAEPDAPYFKGKTMRVIVNYEPGSSADLFGRLIAKHLLSYLAGKPRMVVVNRAGASGTCSSKKDSEKNFAAVIS